MLLLIINFFAELTLIKDATPLKMFALTFGCGLVLLTWLNMLQYVGAMPE